MGNASDTTRALGTIGSVGLSFVVALVLGFWGGRVLDGWLGTSWIWIVGFLAGFAAGVVNVYRTVGRATAPRRGPGDRP